MDTSYLDLSLSILEEHGKKLTEDQYLKIVELLVTPNNALSIMRQWFVKGKLQDYFLRYIDENIEEIDLSELYPGEMSWFLLESKRTDDELFLILSSWIKINGPQVSDAQNIMAVKHFPQLSTDALLKGLLILGKYSQVCVQTLSESRDKASTLRLLWFSSNN